MKNLTILLVSFFLFAGSQAFSQSVDDIIAKNNKAMGQEKLAKVQTYAIEASVNQMGMELPMKMKMKRPNKFLMEIDLQGQKILQVYNGEKGWMINPMMGSGVQEMNADQISQLENQAIMDSPLSNYKEKGLKANLIGKEDKNGTEVYKIETVDESGQSTTYYIDTETYYIVSMSRVVNAQGQEMEVESVMSDFQTTDGITVARKIEQKTPMGNAEINITKVELNPEIDDSIFSKPAE